MGECDVPVPVTEVRTCRACRDGDCYWMILVPLHVFPGSGSKDAMRSASVHAIMAPESWWDLLIASS